MMRAFIQLRVVAGLYYWTYDSIARQSTKFKQSDDACEHFVRLLITTGAQPWFGHPDGKRVFKGWLNKQPNKVDLAELINLRELVR